MYRGIKGKERQRFYLRRLLSNRPCSFRRFAASKQRSTNNAHPPHGNARNDNPFQFVAHTPPQSHYHLPHYAQWQYEEGTIDRVPRGATRAPDRIPRVLCSKCSATNDATFNFCQHCGTPPFRKLLEPPETTGGAAVVVVDESLLQARKTAITQMKADKGGQKRKVCSGSPVRRIHEGTIPERSGVGGFRCRRTRLPRCWLDSKGSGTTVVHARDCPEVGSKSLVKCEAAKGCSKRYAASSLEKGFTSKLKCGMAELLGKTRAWNDTEKTGNPVDSKRVKNYLKCAREEQRAVVGVTVNQARPMLAPLLTQLIRYMRRTANGLPTPSERVARRRDIALYVVAFHTAQRGFDLSCALTAQVLKLPDREGLIFNLHFGKSLRDSSHAIVVRRDRECPDLCPGRAIEEFVGVTKGMGWAPKEGYLFPEVNVDGSRGGNKLAAATMTANLQAVIKLAGLDEGRNYTMHSFLEWEERSASLWQARR